METTEKYYVVVDGKEIMIESIYPIIHDNENGKTSLHIIVGEFDADYGILERMFKNTSPVIEVFRTTTNAEGEETPKLKVSQYNHFHKNFRCAFNTTDHPNCYSVELDRCSDAEIKIEELRAELDLAQQAILMSL